MVVVSNPVVDLLVRIKNAALRKKKVVIVPYSRFKIRILAVLREKHYIFDFNVSGSLIRNISIYLKYELINQKKVFYIYNWKFFRCLYAPKERLVNYLFNNGFLIVSTSKKNKPICAYDYQQLRRERLLAAKKEKSNICGGKVLFHIWKQPRFQRI